MWGGPVMAERPVNAERFVAVHGHFYQPPRENPWLEAVEIQDSAAPYHDWNERVTRECYAPNTAARRVGQDNRILDIVNNFQKISFNVGPTLFSWLDRHAPNAYQNILEADRQNAKAHGGHGNALAQVYNHMILPRADRLRGRRAPAPPAARRAPGRAPRGHELRPALPAGARGAAKCDGGADR